jgi:hypothetical protein
MSEALDKVYEQSETAAKKQQKSRKSTKKTPEEMRNNIHESFSNVFNYYTPKIIKDLEKVTFKGTGKANKQAKEDGQGPKPMTDYLLWLHEHRVGLRGMDENGVKRKEKEVVSAAGPIWNAMTVEEKRPYRERAAKLKYDYAIDLEQLKMANALKRQQASTIREEDEDTDNAPKLKPRRRKPKSSEQREDSPSESEVQDAPPKAAKKPQRSKKSSSSISKSPVEKEDSDVDEYKKLDYHRSRKTNSVMDN